MCVGLYNIHVHVKKERFDASCTAGHMLSEQVRRYFGAMIGDRNPLNMILSEHLTISNVYVLRHLYCKILPG